MKHMYRVTRPTWVEDERTETVVIFIASAVLAIYAASGERLVENALAYFRVPTSAVEHVWPLVDLVIVTLGCLWLIKFYKRQRIKCYPSTFIYVFNMPEASNPIGKTSVVGYGYIVPDIKKGDIVVRGASFHWRDGVLGQRTGFTSTSVRGSDDHDDGPICHIFFDINEEDRPTRHYSHGILQFQLVPNGGTDSTKDAYAAYLESYKKKAELQNVVFRARGYAEWLCAECASEAFICQTLRETGKVLLAKLDALCDKTPRPTLWKKNPLMASERANVWKHDIPTPQSAILNEILYPYIERYLNSVLKLFGLDASTIEEFQALVLRKAQSEDTLVGYEKALKGGLVGQGRKADAALNQRAEIIYNEIKGFFVGDSLLDIGCGNGLISKLAETLFERVRVMDVVDYVPKAFNLDFTLYTEGQAFPIDETFDTVLLLTVLHHATAPVEMLKLAWGATRKRLIIIESVVGVRAAQSAAKYELLDVSDEHQIAFAAFVDWFYNRVLHNDVPVPCNFTTVENWQATFSQHNMRLVQTVHFGQDIEIGPEYHVLFVLEQDWRVGTLATEGVRQLPLGPREPGSKPTMFESWAGGERVTLVLLFTDIVGSTAMGERLQDKAMNSVRHAHFQQTKDLLRRFRGFEVKSLGDGVIAAFKSADAALDYAVELQRNPGHHTLRVRIGIHVGPVNVQGNDVFGSTVNFTARVLQAAQGPEIWLSDDVKRDVEQLGAEEHKRIQWEVHENVSLKGFSESAKLWSIAGNSPPAALTVGRV